MVILNTTFLFDSSIHEQGVEWIKRSYQACAVKMGAQNPMLTRIMADAEADGHSYALHLAFESLADAQKWNEGVGASLRKLLYNRWGEKALTMQTYLEVI